MTLTAIQLRTRLSMSRWRSLCVTLFLVLGTVSSTQAAEIISAYVDANGRVVFVNEGSKSALSGVSSSPSSSDPARKVLASTTGANSNLSSSAGRNNTAGAPGSPSSDLDAMIRQAAAQHQIDPDLIRAIVQVESNFNPYAVSPKGASGLMQLIPATAQRFGVANPFDPRANLEGGIRYLKHLLGLYEGDLQLTLAAYNAGENSVARFGGIPHFRETQDYIRKIGALYPVEKGVSGFRRAPQIMRFVDSTGVLHFSNTDAP